MVLLISFYPYSGKNLLKEETEQMSSLTTETSPLSRKDRIGQNKIVATILTKSRKIGLPL